MQATLDAITRALDILERITDMLGWGGIAVAFVLMAIGQVVKRMIPKHRADDKIAARLFHGTLTLHPMAAGFLLGLFPGMPVPGYVTTSAGAALYFTIAGGASVVLYEALKTAWRFLVHPGLLYAAARMRAAASRENAS